MQIRIGTPGDFDFLECLKAHGWRRLLPFRWDEEEAMLERVEEFAPGHATVLRLHAESGAVVVETRSDVPREELIQRARRMLQLDIPMSSFHAYCEEHSELSHIPGLRQGRLLTGTTLFEDTLKVIATTNTTWTQTIAMTGRIVENFGTPVEGEDTRRAFPRPEQIASVPLDEFAAVAKMGYRNTAAHKIATDVAEGRLDLKSWIDPEIPSPELFKRLLSLPGIGPYAASCLMIYLGRYDRVNVDSWARMMVGKELERTVTDKEAHAFFEKYGEWKALAYHFYKWREEEPMY